MSRVYNLFQGSKEISGLIEQISGSDKNTFYFTPLYGASKSFLVKSLSGKKNQIVVLFQDIKSVQEFVVEMDSLGLNDITIAFDDFSNESIQEKLTLLLNKEKFIVASTYNFLLLQLPDKDNILKNTITISLNSEITYDGVLEYLNLFSYEKDKFVEAPGDYSVRGSIIDFWSFSEKNPIRLEFDGDFLETIRHFDAESQRSIENVNSTSIASSFAESITSFTDIFNYLKEPAILASLWELQNIKVEVAEVETTVVDDQYDFEESFPQPEEQAVESDNSVKIAYKLNDKALWLLEDELGASNERIDLGLQGAPGINANYSVLFNILQQYSDEDYSVIISAENETQSYRLKELLSDFKEEISALIDEGKVIIETLLIKNGFILKEKKLLLLTDYQIFNKPFRTKVIKKKNVKKGKPKSFLSISKGDYVVHEDYGIGKYLGLETIKIGDANQESMKILYNDGGVVYVNLNYLHLVKKFSSDENLTPTLSTLGTGTWENTKKKTKKKIKEAARELIELYAKRKSTKGYAFNYDTIWQKELEASFFYEDTPDQLKVTEEVKADMEAENPMDRLVCGDVGFGKTEIAVRAAFKAVQDNKQAAVLVPTTILAEQHFNTFADRLQQFPVKVAALSRFQTKKEQTEIVKHLEEGKVDIVIGTHRLLSKDVKFKDLGILIIDEEHRFGVAAKEKLKSFKINVDSLTLTATPIPRTLNLSLLGARDLSLIQTPPPNRQPIYTQVAIFDIKKIRQWVLNELNRNGQIYVVHDRVHSIYNLADYFKRYIPEVKIAVAHGQMKPAQLEEVIHAFMNKKFDILMSTKIIESGIDIPNVNTIIINRADRFGLAELHQLRGRVGRSNRQAYAYFLVPSLNGISKKALKRLQAIEEYTDIGAGFNLSMRDLEIRGAGNLLGNEQHGFINEVGFDLYIKLINEAVEELKYQEFSDLFKNLPKPTEKTETLLDTFFDIGISDKYVPEQMDRLNFYTALYSALSLKDIDDVKDELTDRFGELPITTKRLIAASKLKYYAGLALFTRVIIQRKNIIIVLPKPEKEDFYKNRFPELMRFVLDNYKDRLKLVQQKETLKLEMNNIFESPDHSLEYLIRFMREVARLYGTLVDSVDNVLIS